MTAQQDKPCHDCVRGTVHAGEPQGTFEPLHGLQTYIVGNRTTAKATVVIYSDIFGHGLVNNLLIADAYAKSTSHLVLLPDFFRGDPVGLSMADAMIPVDASKQSTWAKYSGMLANAPSFVAWMMRHKAGPTDKVCMDFLSDLRRATPRGRKIGIVGMCWGGRYALRAGLEENLCEVEMEGKTGRERVPLVDAVVALHPSNLVLPGDVEGLVVPVTFGWGVEDQVVSIALKGKVEEIHEKAGKAGRKVPEMEHLVYKPGRHGFSVRGNPDDPQERACLEGSLKQGLDWFERWL